MKRGEIPLKDKPILRERAVIESINDELKNVYQIEHTRHRSLTNFDISIWSFFFLFFQSLEFLKKEEKPLIHLQFICFQSSLIDQ